MTDASAAPENPARASPAGCHSSVARLAARGATTAPNGLSWPGCAAEGLQVGLPASLSDSLENRSSARIHLDRLLWLL